MRRLPAWIAIFCLLLQSQAWAAAGSAARRIAALEASPMPAFRIPPVVKRTLSNGVRCYFLEDHTLPLMQFQLLLPTGAIYDPADLVGLNAMTLSLLRTGGTSAHSAEAVDEALDRDAIEIDFDTGLEMSMGNLRALSQVTDRGLEWFFEILFAPAFEPGRVALARAKAMEGLRRQNDRPDAIAHREFRKLVYGRESPWARTPTRASIRRITTAGMRAAHAAMLSPDGLICAAAGDIRPDTLVKQLERLFAKYPFTNAPRRTPPPAPALFRAEQRQVPRKVAQSAIMIGHRGTDRDNPDKYPLVVMDEILGSTHTFTSWLTSRIRTERGLAYEVWSQYGFGPREAPGLWRIHAKTRPEATGEVVGLIKEQIDRMHDGGAVTSQDVAVMKDSIRKRMIFEYEEPFNIVTAITRFVYLGLPEDYLARYQAGIERVTLSDVRRVAKQYLHPEALQTLIVGNP
ncbi:MAG: insulinase family protein [Deltaproteobacteria bacterium]|nr:insulinase family protein [Deltaproteobacteria bacterium]